MKGMLNTRLSTATAVAADGTIPFGSAVHGFGSSIRLDGNSIRLSSCGKAYFRIVAHITSVVGAGVLTVNMLDNGTVIDSAAGTSATAGDYADLSFVATVYIPCCGGTPHNITFVTDSAITVQDFAVEVEQL